MRDRYLSIMDYFGVRKQMKKLNEECYELVEAIDNYEDYLAFGYGEKKDEISASTETIFRDAIVEEMGDLLNVCTQFILRYGITQDELDLVMNFKLERTEDLIEEGYFEEIEKKKNEKRSKTND